MAISWTPTFGSAFDNAFGNNHTFTGLTMGTGDILVYMYCNSGSGVSVTAVGGGTLTQLDSLASNNAQLWISAGVNTATGSITVTGTALGALAVCGGLITGENRASATVTTHNMGGGDPQQVTGTVPSGGFGWVGMGAATFSSVANPTSWTGATTDGPTCEANVTTDNGVSVAAAHTFTAGSQTPSATANTSGWAFSGGYQIMVTFSAAAAGGHGLFQPSNLDGLSTGGPFFSNPLAAPAMGPSMVGWRKRGGLFVSDRIAA